MRIFAFGKKQTFMCFCFVLIRNISQTSENERAE